ncbi:MAG: hypothetical protein IJF98_08420 [Firmicutes bacterium]|nr:hypothetical protein [Bacillota bacterium]
MKKALAFLILSAIIVSATACEKTENTSAQSAKAEAQDAVSAEEEPEENPYNEPGSDEESIVFDEKIQFAGYPVGIDGFSDTDPDSFASRAVGAYKLEKTETTDEYEPDSYLEIYNVGGNLYGFYSEWGYAAIEFFAEDPDEFASKDAFSVPVKTLTFSNQSNAGEYWSDGLPAELTMNITDKGLRFTDYNELSGESYLPADADFVRLDEEMGYAPSFDYKSRVYSASDIAAAKGIELTDNPHDIVGIWRTLGSEDYAPVFEFTKDGLVQIYMKNYGEEVMLYRGTYCTAAESVNGTQIYMSVMALGWSSEPHLFSFCYDMAENGEVQCLAGDGRFGEDVLWENAVLLPIKATDIPRFSWADIGEPEFGE